MIKTMLKGAYKRIWVPVMGRLISMLIPLIEGKATDTLPTYDIDGDKKDKEKLDNYFGNDPPWQ